MVQSVPVSGQWFETVTDDLTELVLPHRREKSGGPVRGPQAVRQAGVLIGRNTQVRQAGLPQPVHPLDRATFKYHSFRKGEAMPQTRQNEKRFIECFKQRDDATLTSTGNDVHDF
ncbi:hypothetical protein Misp04_59510 [Micromonospora sp. NBRC 101691]|nr:hypothetical protein Misp04_59510 [Micromonospora sp. NBRC 101691]